MSVTGIAGWYNINGGVLSIRFPDEMFESTTAEAVINLKNRYRLFPLFLMDFGFNGSKGQSDFISSMSTIDTSIFFKPLSRGTLSEVEINLSSTFPVNFFVRFRKVKVKTNLTVFPKLLPYFIDKSDNDEKEGESALSNRSGSGEYCAISDYSPDVPLNRILWKLSARDDSLKVKQLSQEAGDPLVIDFDKIRGGDIEERISFAAWLVDDSFRSGIPTSLKIGELLIPAENSRLCRLKMLEALALYEKH